MLRPSLRWISEPLRSEVVLNQDQPGVASTWLSSPARLCRRDRDPAACALRSRDRARRRRPPSDARRRRSGRCFFAEAATHSQRRLGVGTTRRRASQIESRRIKMLIRNSKRDARRLVVSVHVAIGSRRARTTPADDKNIATKTGIAPRSFSHEGRCASLPERKSRCFLRFSRREKVSRRSVRTRCPTHAAGSDAFSFILGTSRRRSLRRPRDDARITLPKRQNRKRDPMVDRLRFRGALIFDLKSEIELSAICDRVTCDHSTSPAGAGIRHTTRRA